MRHRSVGHSLVATSEKPYLHTQKKRHIRTWVVLFSVPLGGISGPICASHMLRPSSAPPSTHEIYLPHGSKLLVFPAGVCMGPFRLDFALLFLAEKNISRSIP